MVVAIKFRAIVSSSLLRPAQEARRDVASRHRDQYLGQKSLTGKLVRAK